MKQIRNGILIFAVSTFAVLTMVGLWPIVLPDETVNDMTNAPVQPLLIMAALGSMLACVGYSISLALPPARTVSLGASSAMGIAVGCTCALCFAFETSFHPGVLAIVLLGISTGLTWFGKRRWGSIPTQSIAVTANESLSTRQARRLVRPHRRRR